MKNKLLSSLFFCIFLISFASAWADNSSLIQNVDGCNELNTTNATYILTSDVNSTDTCFNITAENITLDCGNYIINYSIAGGANTYGIFSNNTNLTKIMNCNVTEGNLTSAAVTRYGIYLESSNNNTLLNNYVITNKSEAIYLWKNNFSNLTSNTATSEKAAAFFIEDSFNNDLFFNTGISNPSKALIDNYCRGFYLGYSPNNNLVSNTGMGWGNESYDGNSDGFFLYYSHNCTLTNNTGITTRDAIILYSTDNCTLINNTGTSETGVGIYLYYSSNNTLINNTGTSNRTTIWGENEGYGIWIGDYAHNNILISTTGIANDGNGIGIGYSSNNTLIKSTAISYNSTSVDYPAILFWQADNTTFFDCINVSGTLTDVYSLVFFGEGSVENTFTNCSYNTSKEVVNDVGDGSTNSLIKKWYYLAYVNYSNGTLAAGANISAYNTSNDLQFTELTNGSGGITRKELIEYVNTNGTRYYYNNYTINANKSGTYNYTNIFNFTVQTNKIDDWFTLNVSDATSPYFTTIPDNASLFYSNQSLLVIFVATDETAFWDYSVNDTRFTINQTGFLSNITSMAVGNYEINVTINDTSNNINWTEYTVQVNQSQDSCDVYFNDTSPITYPTSFIAYTNCTSDYILNLNETIISNSTTINGGTTAYNISVQRTDTANYTYTFTQQQFIIDNNTENCRVLFNATSPLTYPTTFLVWANCTSAFVLARNGTTITNNSEQALVVGSYNFSFLRNDSANYTYIYNETQFVINAPDLTPPTYTSVSHNSTYVNQKVNFSINITDNEALHPNGRYIFSTNNTGAWVNNTVVNFTATPSLVYVLKTLNSTVGMVIGYRWYFNDSAGNLNSTSIYKLKTTEEEEEEEDDDDSGSGGGDDEEPLFKPAYKQIQVGYEMVFRENYRLQINLSTKGIYLSKIEDVNRFTGNVTLSVNNTNYSVELNKSIKINLDNDSYYDLQVSVSGITIYNSTRMLFKEIHEEIPSSKNADVSGNVLEDISDDLSEEETDNDFSIEQKFLFFVIVGILAFAAVLVTFLIIIRIKRHRKYYGFYLLFH